MAVAVVGGGVTGLAAAYRLQTLGLVPVVYEAAARVGGVARTERRDGFLAETGPNSLAAPKPSVQALLNELGLADRLVEASSAARKRYIVRDGRLVALPTSPVGLIRSPILSAGAKLRLLREPFVPPAAPDTDESIAGFVRRRLGGEVLDYIAAPFVGGVYAGDPEALSVRHALPKVHGLEQEHGSLAAAAFARMRSRRRHGSRGLRIYSFPAGIGELADTLADRLGDRICRGRSVTGVVRRDGTWTVTAGGQAAPHEAVVFAGPAHAFGQVAFECEGGDRLRDLVAIPQVPVAVVVLGFPRGAVAHPLDGFGVLVPTVERRRILGVLFSSTLFPGRAPKDHITLTTFIGGARQPELVRSGPDALVGLAREELAELLGAFGEPAIQHVAIWPRAIPQYVVGYTRWLDTLDQVETANPGLAFAGAYRDGVSLGDAIGSGLAAGERLAVHLAGNL